MITKQSIHRLCFKHHPSEYWFGTDSLGRDVFTRTIMGEEATTITFFGSLIALLWGGLLGIFCGLVGGKIDDVVMRVVDAFLSIPPDISNVVNSISFRNFNRGINPCPWFFLW